MAYEETVVPPSDMTIEQPIDFNSGSRPLRGLTRGEEFDRLDRASILRGAGL